MDCDFSFWELSSDVEVDWTTIKNIVLDAIRQFHSPSQATQQTKGLSWRPLNSTPIMVKVASM